VNDDGAEDRSGAGAGTVGIEISESLRAAMSHVRIISQSLPQSEADAGSTTSSLLDMEDPTHHFLSQSHTKIGEGEKKYHIPGLANAMDELSLFGLMGKIIEENANGNGLDGDSIASANANATASPLSSSLKSTTNTTRNTTTTEQTQNSGMGMKRVKSATSLSHALKHGTQESHSAAESVHFVKEFIQGNIDQTLYSILILNLLHLYRHLEKLLEDHAPSEFPSLHFPKELSRLEALEEDVDYFHGSDVGKRGKASSATEDYVKRIEFIAETEPLLLLSHAYTRYMGDLSGGKVLARVAKRALKLEGGDGLAFYEFEAIPSAKVFKDQYRMAMDGLELEEDQIERLVAEANVAFILNMRIFEELDVMSGVEGSLVRDYEMATVYYDKCLEKQAQRKLNGVDRMDGDAGVGAAQEEEGDGHDDITKCPFAMLGGPNPHGNSEQNSNSATPSNNGNKSRSIEKNVTTTSDDDDDEENGRCPWPFIFFHDPKTGMQDYQTWIMIGLLMCFFYRSKSSDASLEEDENDITASITDDEPKSRCPWPFIYLHDPMTGMQDFQTWILVGLVAVYYAWSLIFSKTETNDFNERATPPVAANVESREICPWPFIFAHDPKTGMQDYKTWIVIGLLSCFVWSSIQKYVL